MRKWFVHRGDESSREEEKIRDTTEVIENSGRDEEPMNEKESRKKCPKCGAELEEDAKFCTMCAAPLTPEAEARAAGLETWALRAGERIGGLSKGVKFGVPLLVLFVVGIIIALFVIASGHTPQAAVERYLSRLKVGDWNSAYEMLVHPGGSFSDRSYFLTWQNHQAEKCGRLTEYSVYPGGKESRLFGRLLEDKQESGTDFSVRLEYQNDSFDVDITAQGAGGFWPFNRHRILLSTEPTKAIVAPAGSSVFIDGKYVGDAEENEGLKKAMSLGDFPQGIRDVPDYAKRLVDAGRFIFDEAKAVLENISSVTGEAQSVLSRFGAHGGSWVEVVDAVKSTVSESKELSREVARIGLHLYWIFGGGDDGSLRAKLTRTESGLELNGLPEGYHTIRVEFRGCKPLEKGFYAPLSVEANPDADTRTKESLKGALGTFFAAKSEASKTGNLSFLSQACSGKLLDDEYAEMEKNTARGYLLSSDLMSVKYENFKVLSGKFATADTVEVWNSTTFRAGVPVSSVSGIKKEMTYLLEKKGEAWVPIERKIK
ncbi:MAG: zinc-ribbon domain-containing protein [Actinomycetota bacterium]|nr:zinc-ribbon domain-containing protein [Actinomycetota bacterium]